MEGERRIRKRSGGGYKGIGRRKYEMLRLKQIRVVNGEFTLFFEADGFPEGVRQIQIPQSEVVERLKELKRLTGRKPTLRDVKDIIKVLVDEMRRKREPFPQRFDFTKWIDMDLEAEEA